MDLFLLIVSVAIAAYAVATTSAVTRAHAAIRRETAGIRYRDLGHYDLAYLAGGPHRVADTAIATLAERHDLRVSRGGRVHRVISSTVAREPVEEAVLGMVAARSGLPVMSLRIEVARSLAMDEIKQRLLAHGLLLPDDVFTRARALAVRLRVLSLAAYAGFVIEGLTMVVAPNLYALLATLVFLGTAFGAEVVLGTHRRALRATLTASGREALDSARQANARGVAEGPVPLALYGVESLRDPTLRAELGRQQARRERRRGSSYAGGGSSSCGGGGGSAHGTAGCGSGSSCGGGGGCGGGGCGGGS
ncbi:TIGR04222 domain-containing membrane protein [Nonomuraea rubra]|uniref:Uncharacterized protein (TIGR04222 family) n=1 Tax=Nonomuraea rubra TaxID=46180 RepID=A0A7X0TW15_9ACTN|nr:TIGR04222 domain-containing membrane protein [Nonomuraea rubra]MBB6546062.1 uncharacterized protein (TIGR04222 family) [Nonomuraea rubra]